MEQRIENSEVFRLTDDQSAEWAVRKIREARRDTEQWEAHFAGQMERIRKANEETEAYFTTLLAEWFAIQPKRETKTQAKYSLPGADLVRRKQQPSRTTRSLRRSSTRAIWTSSWSWCQSQNGRS